MTYTYDAARPPGTRITSIRVERRSRSTRRSPTGSAPSASWPPAATTSGSSSRAPTRDSGLVDRDLWISYLQETLETVAAPIAPDFARQQVFETGKPESVEAGQHVEFTLGPDLLSPFVPTSGEKLDLTSLGSPANTSVTMTAVAADGGTTDLGSVPVTSGTAAVAFDVPAGLAEGSSVVLEAQPSGTTVTIPVTAAAAVESNTTATATPVQVKVSKHTSDIDVTVSSAGATLPTGEVVVLDGETEFRATLTAGHATVTVGPFDTVGPRTLEVHYLGDEVTAPSETTVDVEVLQRNPIITVERTPRRVVAGETRTLLTVNVNAGEGITATGPVEVRRGGEVLDAGRLDDAGTVRLRLPGVRQGGREDRQGRLSRGRQRPGGEPGAHVHGPQPLTAPTGGGPEGQPSVGLRGN